MIKKWLSYREKPLLGRGLNPGEVRYVTEMTRRLASLIALQSSLDANYQSVSKPTYGWKVRGREGGAGRMGLKGVFAKSRCAIQMQMQRN